MDTFDQPAFPHRGISLLARSEAADTRIGSGATFRQHLLDVRAALPVASKLTVHARAFAAAAGGADLPFHYQFFMGGTIPSSVFTERQPTFPGLRAQERAGRSAQPLQLGVQLEPAKELFVTANAHVGNTADAWSLRFADYRHGYEVSVGALTFLGPLELVTSAGDLGDRPTVEVRLGYLF